jgi:hypothetical protein
MILKKYIYVFLKKKIRKGVAISIIGVGWHCKNDSEIGRRKIGT